MNACPYCREDIQEAAAKCRYCHSMVVSPQPPLHDDRRVTYVVDTDLVRFAKFALATVAVFTVVGLFLFGFNLKDMAKELSDAQTALATSEAKLGEAQVRMDAGLEKLRLAENNVDKLQSSTEALKKKADEAVVYIAEREAKSRELLIAIETRSGNPVIKTVSTDDKHVTGGAGKLWKNGARIGVAFVGGEERYRRIVRESASEWTKYANLDFDFSAAPEEAEIRIAFEAGQGSWSFIGTDGLNLPTKEQTMNIDSSWDPDAVRIAVLTYFGHAIGLLKEHQNPNASIPWDRDAVRRHFGSPPYAWDEQVINRNLFDVWKAGSFPLRKDYDPSSIMHYPIPNDLTVGDFEVLRPTALSDGDKAWVARLYPGR